MINLEKLNLSKTVTLDEHDNRFQLVYATQLYDSLFALLARFQTERLENGNLMIKQMDFLGMNYKGPLNLGIVNISVKKPDDKLAEGILEVDLMLQANDASLFTREINKKELDIEIDTSNTGKKILKVVRSLAPMYEGNSNDVMDQAFVNGKFDSEFFERDGVFVKRKEKNHENQFSDDDRMSIPEVSDPMNASADLIGATCRIGESILTYS